MHFCTCSCGEVKDMESGENFYSDETIHRTKRPCFPLTHAIYYGEQTHQQREFQSVIDELKEVKKELQRKINIIKAINGSQEDGPTLDLLHYARENDKLRDRIKELESALQDITEPEQTDREPDSKE